MKREDEKNGLLTFTLTGCVDAKFHLTVNKDGSGDFAYKMLMDPMVLGLMGQSNGGSSQDPLKEMLDGAKKSGFTTSNLNENNKVGFEAKKHLNNIPEELKKGQLFGQPNMDKSFKPGDGLTIEKTFLKTTYKLKSDLDMSDMAKSQPGETPETAAMTQGMLKSMKFDFAITLPVKAKTNNASKNEDDGKTLVWNLIPGQHNEISMEAEALNTTNITIVSIGAIMLIALIIVVVIRKRSHN